MGHHRDFGDGIAIECRVHDDVLSDGCMVVFIGTSDFQVSRLDEELAQEHHRQDDAHHTQRIGDGTAQGSSATRHSQLLQGLRQQHTEQASLTQQIASLAAANVAQSKAQQELPGLLAELLRQQPGLSLIKLNTVSDTPKFAGNLTLPGWHWQGVELRVAGDYLALLRYLRQLEQSLPGLHWGEMKLSAPAAGQTGGPTALLQLQVFLLKAK